MSSGPFALWLTGVPAAGKSSIAREAARELRRRNVPLIVLESDEMRKILTPEPAYTEAERDRFYRELALIGVLIMSNGISVIFDATANKRAYRDYARGLIPRFVEAYVDCPAERCRQRDPKGIYARAAAGKAATVPGIQSSYEPPLRPELTLNGQVSPADSAVQILDYLHRVLYI